MNKLLGLICVVCLSVFVGTLNAQGVDVVVIDEVGFLPWLLANTPDLIKALGLVVAAASAVATMTPNKTDDSILAWLARVANFLALNFGHAKSVEALGDEVIKPDSGGH